MNKTVVIIQARMGSTRLPGKVLADVAGYPLLYHVLNRARQIAEIDEVMVATTTLPADEQLLGFARRWGAPAYAGSCDDVLDRYYQAGRQTGADTIVRVTADCPLLDPEVAGSVLARFRQGDLDYASNTHPPTFPDGLDTEVCSFETLRRAWCEGQLKSEREHVMPYIWKHPELFRLGNVTHSPDLSALRWTVDEPEDLEFVRRVFQYMRCTPSFGMPQVLDLLQAHPELGQVNAAFERNEGYRKSLNQDGIYRGESK